MQRHCTDLSTYMLQATLLPLAQDEKCSNCQVVLRDRVACTVIEWAFVRVSSTFKTDLDLYTKYAY